MPTRLTKLISHFSPRDRIKRRRRIEAMVQRWAGYLQEKHGHEAKYRCRHHLVNSIKMRAGLRNQVWSRVYEVLSSKGAD